MGRKMTDRSDLLASRLFWAMWYYLQIGTDDQDGSELVQTLFGVSNDDVNQFFLTEIDPDKAKERSICVRIPLRRGFALGIEFDSDEHRYVVSNDSWKSTIVLGYHSGHFALPAFRWQEIKSIGRFIAKFAIDPWHRRSGHLLFFPGVYLTSEDDIDEVRVSLLREWQTLGAANMEQVGMLVDQIIDNLTNEILWHNDSELGWTNNGRYSLRNPETRMCAFDLEKFRRISEFMDMVGVEEGDD
jgi:ribulose bisphosphate carboxylase small subunit